MNHYPTLICELMNKFYNLGWCSGTGGGISIYDKENETIYMAPSAVQKESLEPSDIFELNRNGSIKTPIEGLQLSECAPLFHTLYDMRNAGAVLHSHALECVLVGRKFEGARASKICRAAKETARSVLGSSPGIFCVASPQNSSIS